MSARQEAYKSLPGVDTLLVSPEVAPLLSAHGKELVTFCIRLSLDHFREQLRQGSNPPAMGDIAERVSLLITLYGGRNLKRVINATGIILHTNLGRAPFSPEMLNDSFEVLSGYCNLEFDLSTGARGNRNDHARSILKFITGAEDILIVNNAAAAVMLILRAFAKEREVIVSRGELIEIGGSFRIPEIMAASDCRMVEVGTTNKTRLQDYQKAINDHTALLFKAHKSNYVIKGFSEEVSTKELARLSEKHGIPFLYDLGSGLIRKVPHPAFAGEPDVREAIATGADLICFSGDKLLGGPQAGIIAGKKELISKLSKEPMLRALRVCKATLALLETACLYYLREEELISKNMIYKALERDKKEILSIAEKLRSYLKDHNIESEVTPSPGQCGGGSLPDTAIDSFSVVIKHGKTNRESSDYAEKMFKTLLQQTVPILGILKQGNLVFNMLTVDEKDIEIIGREIVKAHLTHTN